MKLLIIHQHYVIPRYQEFVYHMMQHRPDIEIHVLCPKVFKMGKVYKAKKYKNVNFHTLSAPLSRYGAQHFFFFIGLIKFLKKINPTHIWAQAPNSINTFQIILSSYFLNIKPKIILLRFTNFYRNYFKLYGFFNVRRYLFTFLRWFSYRKCDGIVSIDKLVTKTIRKEGFKGKIFEIMTMGVSDIFYNQGKKMLVKPLQTKNFKIAYFGRITPYKGIDNLILAINELNNPNISLTIQGSGDYLKHIKKLVNKFKMKNVQFLPFVDYEDVPLALSKFHLVILPSVKRGIALEQFGRVLVEAQACGVAVIGSNLGGIPNAILKGGIIVEPENINDLKNKIHLLFKNRDLLEKYRKIGFESSFKYYSDFNLSKKFINGFIKNF